MDDKSLNRAIESALNAEPSPEFLARVRTRMSIEPAPSRWRLAWVMVPAVSVGVVALAFVIATSLRPDLAPPNQAVAPAPDRPGAPVALAEVAEPVARDDRRTVRRVRLQPDRMPGTASRLPEVLVSVDERRTLEYVAAMVSDGRVADLTVERADTGLEAVTLRDVEIVPLSGLAPVRIEPLQIARLEEGERQ
jgi:hypothetical protein